MKTFEEIKLEYAKERGRKSWENLMYSTERPYWPDLYGIVAERYANEKAKAVLEEAAGTAKVKVIRSSIVDETGEIDVRVEVDKESILSVLKNENE